MEDLSKRGGRREHAEEEDPRDLPAHVHIQFHVPPSMVGAGCGWWDGWWEGGYPGDLLGPTCRPMCHSQRWVWG